MNRHPKPSPQRIKNPAYRPAFERLDEALEKNTQPENSEKIQLLGRCMFGDLWHEHKQTRTGVLPK